MKLEKRLTKALSYLLHPLLMPTYASIMILNSNYYLSAINIEIKNYIYLLFFFFTFCVPLSAIALFNLFGFTSKPQMKEREKRIVPLAIVTISYLLCLMAFRYYSFPVLFTKLIFSFCILAALTLLITKYWEISLHCLGIGGLIGFLFNSASLNINVFYYILLSVLIGGIVGTLSLYLKKHNNIQIYSAYFIGFITIFVLS